MNRRSFLWQSLCSSLSLVASANLSQQAAALPFSKPGNADLTAFARGLAGTAFRPGDPKYEQLRKGYAAKFDAHPLVIVHSLNLQDIQTTLSFVSANHLPLAVRCGGHSYAGYSTCDGGLVLDMSGFRSTAIAAEEVLPVSAAECCAAQLRSRPPRQESLPYWVSVLLWV